MTVNRTTLLDLPLPVTGTESGTWGDTTNNGLTQYLDIAIAGTLVLSTDADVTLTSTEGDSSATNIGATTAQYAILRWTATGSTTRNITALAQSKTYVVINATGGTQSIVLRGAGPTTGVTIISGEKALCVWNGSDFVKVSSSAAAGGSNTQVQYNSSGVLAGSSNMTFDGTSLTLGGNPTLSAGTANGVLYLNGSKVATSGSALTFASSGTETTLNINSIPGTATYKAGITVNWDDNAFILYGGSGYKILETLGYSTPNVLKFFTNNSEQMRLTSTGLGIGTSSPKIQEWRAGTYLTVANASTRGQVEIDGAVADSGSASLGALIFTYSTNTTNHKDVALIEATSSGATANQRGGALNFYTKANGTASPALNMTLDSSGNLGLGVTPSASGSTYGGSQMRTLTVESANVVSAAGYDAHFAQNAYRLTDGTWRYQGNGGDNVAHLYSQAAGGSHIWYTALSGTAGNAVPFTQAMTLDASGNLGVGTTSPVNKFVVSNAGAVGAETRLTHGDGSTAGASFLSYNRSGSAFTPLEISGSYLKFSISDVEKARITSGGELLVGTTDAGSTTGTGVKLLPSGYVYSVAPSTTNDTYNYYNSTAAAYRFYVTNAGTIYATNTTISAISDQRFKENIRDLDVGLNAIMTLKPRKFDWKAGKGKDIKGDRGFIAQEFEQVFPDLIDEWKDPAPEGEEPYKSVRQDLIPVLVKAIQEQQALITSLTARVALLEGN